MEKKKKHLLLNMKGDQWGLCHYIFKVADIGACKIVKFMATQSKNLET